MYKQVEDIVTTDGTKGYGTKDAGVAEYRKVTFKEGIYLAQEVFFTILKDIKHLFLKYFFNQVGCGRTLQAALLLPCVLDASSHLQCKMNTQACTM